MAGRHTAKDLAPVPGPGPLPEEKGTASDDPKGSKAGRPEKVAKEDAATGGPDTDWTNFDIMACSQPSIF